MDDFNDVSREESTLKSARHITEAEDSAIDLRHTNQRYLLLLFANFLCFGCYYVYDNPSALETQLKARLDMNSFEYNMLYAVYSFPNFILPLFGGYFLDCIGIRLATLIYSALVVTGQCIFAFAVSIRNYPLALIGRLVFGFGGESLGVAHGAVVANWFRGKDLAFAYGLNLCVSRLGSVLNQYTEPSMDKTTGSPVFGLWIGVLVCIFALVCGVALVTLDKRRDTLLGVTDKRKLPASGRVKLSEIRDFGAVYWLISINCLVVYVCIMSFNNIGTRFFQIRFGFSEVNSGYVVGVTYLVAAVIVPPIGWFVDHYGKRTLLIVLSAVLATLVHVTFVLLPDCDECVWGILDLVALGLCYSIYASVMWACVPYIVPPKTIGTAFGVTTSIQNIGLGLAPLAIGALIDNTSRQHGYFYAGVFFIGVGSIGILTAICVYWLDRRAGGPLASRNPENQLNLEQEGLSKSLQSVED